MDDRAQVFVRQELVPQRKAPVRTTGAIAWIQSRLFGSPTSILLTIVSALLLYFTVVPAIQFLLVDAVWTGSDRDACLPEKVGRAVGACWPFVQAKFQQFMYGFYPTEPALAPQPGVRGRSHPFDPAFDPAHSGQDVERRPVLLRLADRCVLPAAWRRHQGLWHQLGVRRC